MGRVYDIALWPDEDPGLPDRGLCAATRAALADALPEHLIGRIGVAYDQPGYRWLIIETAADGYLDDEVYDALAVVAPRARNIGSGWPMADALAGCRHVDTPAVEGVAR